MATSRQEELFDGLAKDFESIKKKIDNISKTAYPKLQTNTIYFTFLQLSKKIHETSKRLPCIMAVSRVKLLRTKNLISEKLLKEYYFGEHNNLEPFCNYAAHICVHLEEDALEILEHIESYWSAASNQQLKQTYSRWEELQELLFRLHAHLQQLHVCPKKLQYVCRQVKRKLPWVGLLKLSISAPTSIRVYFDIIKCYWAVHQCNRASNQKQILKQLIGPVHGKEGLRVVNNYFNQIPLEDLCKVLQNPSLR